MKEMRRTQGLSHWLLQPRSRGAGARMVASCRRYAVVDQARLNYDAVDMCGRVGAVRE